MKWTNLIDEIFYCIVQNIWLRRSKTNLFTFISILGHDSIRECQKGKILQGA